MYGKHKARGDAAKATVTGTYKKSRTKGMDKPDPSRRGAAAYELLKDIKLARERAATDRALLRGEMEAHRSGTVSRKSSAKHIKEMNKEKVEAHRQVQALKQAYNKLPAAERAAGQKMFKKEQSK